MSKRRVAKEDLLRFQWPGSPAVSPDGQWVVWQQTVIREKQDDYETQLWIADREGNRRQLTHTGQRNFHPVWSPDGRYLAFLSNRAYGTQVWLLPLNGGEPRRLTSFRRGFSDPVFSPDGKTLYGLVPVAPDGEAEVFDPDLTAEQAKEQMDKDVQTWRDGPKRYDWIYYKRDGQGLTRGFRRQLVAIDVETGAWRQLTFGRYDVGEPAVSPDGRYIAFASNRHENPELEMEAHVYRVSAAGGDIELLSEALNAIQVAYSPDGRELAVFGYEGKFDTASHIHLYTLPADGGEPQHWTREFPDTLGNYMVTDMRNHEHTPGPLWSRDGRSIYALSSREGRCEVVRFTRDADRVRAEVVIGGDREIYGLSFDGERRFAIAYSTVDHPGRIAWVDVDDSLVRLRAPRAPEEPMDQAPVPLFPATEIRVDDCSDALLAELETPRPQPFWYTSEDGWQVQGWVLFPPNHQPGRKVPVILEIHGGPHTQYGWAYFHELQWFAAQGYAIVYTNPRGSMGYGQAFADACRGDYGGKDAADILNGLNAALKQFPDLDGSRVAVTGGSYGGFMTNWLVGHTDRFFAAVSQRSISNWISFYGVSDIGPRFTESEIGGDVIHDMEKLWRHSPLAYAGNVKTPLLLIHGENDDRCPIEQAEQFYTVIRRNGGDVELVRVPQASHDLSRNGKPSLRLARLERIFGFIDSHLPAGDPQPER